jgi:hypothetical protein
MEDLNWAGPEDVEFENPKPVGILDNVVGCVVARNGSA